jgi:hypothetical protein
VVDPCESDPCQNGATCFSTKSVPPKFTCVCAVGFTGATCNKGVYPFCIALVLRFLTLFQSFKLIIHYCSMLTVASPCDGNPCQNGGSCASTFVCTCAAGYSGNTCSQGTESSSACLSSQQSIDIGPQCSLFLKKLGLVLIFRLLIYL